ncbi:TIGR01741 family protein [Staphylococcus lugdunensis]|uniref:TIGR01741 family protein n=1 Tax=Staphylococcus lugdunensis TaxID=28035 RepID=UPI000A10C667|nr:TIGR01741 family protein [Staphylococcus lugdunensis]ARJ27890.1 hypothetical protein B7469_09345 [Staphylococcus lugdunensis]MCH8674534.1 TIGR01741 family protein [Staphylococcus lugdunensis]MCI2753195.1 TIGR01741 family protein [Staphylococcus lugdunensis]MCI2761611.1 TIGR01741 family protein [Staphylococcus lugdunensis]MCI2806983.1 TIGR01741 family protein [Staphylococcus lugdunensis]
MSFESKLNEQYNKIANHVSDMIPGPWEKVNLVAYMEEYASEVFFFFTVPQKDELYYSQHIPKDFGVSKKEYVNRAFRLCDLFDDLSTIFVEYGQEKFGTCEFDFTIEGKLNVSFEYIDWKSSGFGPGAKYDYYRYKKFSILPEMEYAIKRMHEVEQYVKENQGK